jgi:hypothetical protein
MGEPRQGLGTMASPAELVAAMTAIGLLERGFTGQEQAEAITRAGGVELHRLQMAYALAGAVEMQVLMAAGAAADAGADHARITRACTATYDGASCQDSDDTQFTLVRVQAQRLASQLMVMAADARAGRAEFPLLVYPAMLVATALQKLVDTASIDDPAGRARMLHETAGTLAGGAEVITEMADKAQHFADMYGA